MLLKVLLLLFILIFLAKVNGLEFRIGIIQGTESLSWHNTRHAIDEWNNANAFKSEITFSLIAPVEGHPPPDDKVCDIIQRKVAAIIICPENESIDEILLIYSMCDRFKIPCITTSTVAPLSHSRFVTSIAPKDDLVGKAAAALIQNLGWNSFLLTYQDSQAIPEIANLLSIWHNQRGTRTILKVLQLPSDSTHYEAFLKYVREKLKQTNIVVHTRDVGTIHSILSAASLLNMTESRYSFMFTNPDLSLLDDFFQSLQRLYKCNITGFQLVQHDPLMKTSLALTVDAVSVIGKALTSLYSHGNLPVPETILCESDDTWVDGEFFNEALRQVTLDQSMTGKIIFDGHGSRTNSTLTGITRTNGKFQKLGIFDEATNEWQFEKEYNNKWHFSFNGTGYNLQGHKLKVVVYLEEPFVMKKNEGIGYDGFCIDLLIEMSKFLNFTFEIVEVEDGTYGIEVGRRARLVERYFFQDETGQWNGVIGVLQRHEADLSLSAITITYSRVSAVDFTLPFMHLGIAILMGKNIEETNPSTTASLFTFLEPLSFNVWIALVISYMAVGATLSILARFSPYEWFDIKQIDERDTSMDNHKNQFDLLNSLWFAIGSLMHQGADVIPRAASTRTVAIFWWMFTLIIISTYTAQFAAFLTVERMSTPIESAVDLASQQKIKFGTLRNGSTMDFFRESKIPIYERMWSQMQGQSPAVFVNSSKEAITRVKAGNYAYMMESSMLEYYMKTECSLQTVGGLLDSKGYGVALPKGSPLRDILSKTVLQLQESTILEALKNKWWQGDKDPLICPQTADKHRSLQRVFGIFYVLFAGLIVSILMSMGEFCIESKQKSVRLDLTLLGKFFNWWHRRKFQNEQRLLPNRPQLKVTRLDTLGRETDNIPRRKHAPVVMRTSAGEGHSYLLDEHRETPVDPNSMSDINRRPSREEYRKLSRLIPQRDQNLINRRISTISR